MENKERKTEHRIQPEKQEEGGRKGELDGKKRMKIGEQRKRNGGRKKGDM